jgi:hypothetical protein
MLDLYKHFVRARHFAWKRRLDGEDPPWSFDPIIANHKFTNNYRLLDRGSQFLITELLEPHADDIDILARCFLYRVTNLPKTWYHLRAVYGHYPRAEEMDADLIRTIQEYRDQGNTVFSGAYMIVPQPGKTGDKVQHAVELTRTFLDKHAVDFFTADDQAERLAALAAPYGMGQFLAMQVLTDWGYSDQCGEDRENEFVVDGPGSRRGAKLIDPDKKPVDLIRDLTKMWEDDGLVTLHDRPLSMMDVQNTLCEFMKYARYKTKGDVGHTRYVGNGRLTAPVLPRHFLTASE